MKRTLSGLLALLMLVSAPSIAAAQFIGSTVAITDTTTGAIRGQTVASPLITQKGSEVPSGATQVTGSSGVVSAATAAAALPAVSAKTNYVSGISITGGGATSASLITCTLTGLVTGTQSYVFAVASGATAGSTALQRTFNPPVPASAVNTALTLSCPTFGSGNTAAATNIEGYVQ
jgi:hypothetical protein